MRDAFPILIIVMALATLGVLGIGVVSMLRGGAFNAKYSNKLMRMRVLFQFVTVVLIGLALLVFGR